jgi:26S proteasome regulatory subunit T4
MSAEASTSSQPTPEQRKQKALEAYKAKIKEHESVSESLKTIRMSIRDGEAQYDKSEEDIKALQSVGQIVGELLRQLDEERCACGCSGSREVVTQANSQSSSRPPRVPAMSSAAAHPSTSSS